MRCIQNAPTKEGHSDSLPYNNLISPISFVLHLQVYVEEWFTTSIPCREHQLILFLTSLFRNCLKEVSYSSFTMEMRMYLDEIGCTEETFSLEIAPFQQSTSRAMKQSKKKVTLKAHKISSDSDSDVEVKVKRVKRALFTETENESSLDAEIVPMNIYTSFMTTHGVTQRADVIATSRAPSHMQYPCSSIQSKKDGMVYSYKLDQPRQRGQVSSTTQQKPAEFVVGTKLFPNSLHQGDSNNKNGSKQKRQGKYLFKSFQ